MKTYKQMTQRGARVHLRCKQAELEVLRTVAEWSIEAGRNQFTQDKAQAKVQQAERYIQQVAEYHDLSEWFSDYAKGRN